MKRAHRAGAPRGLPRSLKAALFAVLAVLVAAVGAPVPAGAHGGGVVQAEFDGPGYHLVIETNEDASAGFFGGTVHVTVIATVPGDPTVRLRHLDVHVTGEGPNGATVGPLRSALQLNGMYEVDLTVHDPGEWRFQVHVTQGDSRETVEFPLTVAARPWWSDIGLAGGLFLIPVLALSGMVRRSRRRRRAVVGAAGGEARTGDGTDSGRRTAEGV